MQTYWQQKTEVRVENWSRHTNIRKECVWSNGGDILTAEKWSACRDILTGSACGTADNWSARRKTFPVPLCPPCIPHTTGQIAHPRLRDDRPATERLNHGPACDVLCRYTNSWRNMTKCCQQTPNNVKSIWHCLHSKEKKAVKSVRLSGQFSRDGISQVDVLLIHYGSDNSDYWPPWPITKCT